MARKEATHNYYLARTPIPDHQMKRMGAPKKYTKERIVYLDREVGYEDIGGLGVCKEDRQGSHGVRFVAGQCSEMDRYGLLDCATGGMRIYQL
jgi:hypothetical protein